MATSGRHAVHAAWYCGSVVVVKHACHGGHTRTPSAGPHAGLGAPASALSSLLQEEARIMSTLRHPNIVQLMGTTTLEPHSGLALVLEHVGPSLGDVIESLSRDTADRTARLLPWRTRARVALEAALAIAYLHDQSVVHASIDPWCMLLSFDPFFGPDRTSLKITRFSSARSTRGSAYRENPKPPYVHQSYVAPEVLLAMRRTDRIFRFSIDQERIRHQSGSLSESSFRDNTRRDLSYCPQYHISDLANARCASEAMSTEADMFSFGVVLASVGSGLLPPRVGASLEKSSSLTTGLDADKVSAQVRASLDATTSPMVVRAFKDVDRTQKSWLDEVERRPHAYPLAKILIQAAIACTSSKPAERPNAKMVISVIRTGLLQYDRFKIPSTPHAPSRGYVPHICPEVNSAYLDGQSRSAFPLLQFTDFAYGSLLKHHAKPLPEISREGCSFPEHCTTIDYRPATCHLRAVLADGAASTVSVDCTDLAPESEASINGDTSAAHRISPDSKHSQFDERPSPPHVVENTPLTFSRILETLRKEEPKFTSGFTDGLECESSLGVLISESANEGNVAPAPRWPRTPLSPVKERASEAYSGGIPIPQRFTSGPSASRPSDGLFTGSPPQSPFQFPGDVDIVAKDISLQHIEGISRTGTQDHRDLVIHATSSSRSGLDAELTVPESDTSSAPIGFSRADLLPWINEAFLTDVPDLTPLSDRAPEENPDTQASFARRAAAQLTNPTVAGWSSWGMGLTSRTEFPAGSGENYEAPRSSHPSSSYIVDVEEDGLWPGLLQSSSQMPPSGENKIQQPTESPQRNISPSAEVVAWTHSERKHVYSQVPDGLLTLHPEQLYPPNPSTRSVLPRPSPERLVQPGLIAHGRSQPSCSCDKATGLLCRVCEQQICMEFGLPVGASNAVSITETSQPLGDIAKTTMATDEQSGLTGMRDTHSGLQSSEFCDPPSLPSRAQWMSTSHMSQSHLSASDLAVPDRLDPITSHWAAASIPSSQLVAHTQVCQDPSPPMLLRPSSSTSFHTARSPETSRIPAPGELSHTTHTVASTEESHSTTQYMPGSWYVSRKAHGLEWSPPSNSAVVGVPRPDPFSHSPLEFGGGPFQQEPHFSFAPILFEDSHQLGLALRPEHYPKGPCAFASGKIPELLAPNTPEQVSETRGKATGVRVAHGDCDAKKGKEILYPQPLEVGTKYVGTPGDIRPGLCPKASSRRRGGHRRTGSATSYTSITSGLADCGLLSPLPSSARAATQALLTPTLAEPVWTSSHAPTRESQNQWPPLGQHMVAKDPFHDTLSSSHLQQRDQGTSDGCEGASSNPSAPPPGDRGDRPLARAKSMAERALAKAVERYTVRSRRPLGR